MKKFKQLVLLFLVTSATLVSCNKDDDGDSASIEGSWEFSKTGFIVGGVEQLDDYENTSGCNKDFIEIKSGGMLSDHYFEDLGSGCEELIDNGTWTRDGDNFTLNYTDEVVSGKILELSNTTLKVKATDPDFNIEAIIVFTRK